MPKKDGSGKMRFALQSTAQHKSDMISLPGGVFVMGSEQFYPEEAPLREVRVDPFSIDVAPVTNQQFADFVADTDYKTIAEVAPSLADYPGLPPELAKPGSLVFEPTSGPVDLNDFTQWWKFCFGAWWGEPLGPGSSIEGLEDHPVVHIAFKDANAYAAWAGKELPTEAEWEYAARGGLKDADYAWGDELAPEGEMLANYWQGAFPYQNSLLDGWERTSPVRSYPSNGYGLYDVIGNVWEWTADWYGVGTKETGNKVSESCCIPSNPRGATEIESIDPYTPQIKIGRKILKGGSHLCTANYCQRYRPAARYPQSADTSTSHIGFRCIVRGREAALVRA